MKKIETEIIIEAPREVVWNVLMDFDKYPVWNPFIISIMGEKIKGKLLRVSINPPEGSVMTFKPLILQILADAEFRWKGKLGIRGIFDGEHYFLLEKIDEKRTKFIHGEIFSGILVPIFKSTLQKTKKGFELMNKSLKQKCENVTPAA